MVELASLLKFPAGFAWALSVGAFFSKGDDYVSPELRKSFAAWLKGVDIRAPSQDLPNVFLAIFDKFFGPDPFRFRFMAASFLLSVAAMTLLFAYFVLRQPSFGESLWNNAYQRAAVAGQLLSFAFIVNLVVDWLCLAYCQHVAVQMQKRWSWSSIPLFLAKDLLVKLVFIVVGSALVYVNYAAANDAFGGKTSLALSVLPQTLWEALLFRNTSSIYIYASLVSSLWLWGYLLAVCLVRALNIAPQGLSFLKWALPIDERPIRSIGVIAAFVALLAYYCLVFAL